MFSEPLCLPGFVKSSRSQMFLKIVALKNFANFTGKHLCWSLFSNKGFNFFKKSTPTQVFSCEIAKFSRTPFLQNIRWLLLLLPVVILATKPKSSRFNHVPIM